MNPETHSTRTETSLKDRSRSMTKEVVVDVAGAVQGGAARFLVELESWLASPGADGTRVTLIGRGRRLTPQWLLRRELEARGARRKVALNNASFVAFSGEKTVLLRNALHFCSREEAAARSLPLSRELRLQTPVIRNLARAADRVVVPCGAMADRVIQCEPSLVGRVVVRGHPVTVPAAAPSTELGPRDTILVPIVPAPYKFLEARVGLLEQAIDGLGLKIQVTASEKQLPSLSGSNAVEFLGPLSAANLARYWDGASSIYYPMSFESFGYPLAEARARGRWVIALDSSQNREVAGDALAPFVEGELESLRQAVISTMSSDPLPDPTANAAGPYFRWLFGGARASGLNPD